MRVPDKEYFDIAMREFGILEELKGHPNVIEAYDIFYNQMQEKIFLLVEYAGEGSNLCNYIKHSFIEEESTG